MEEIQTPEGGTLIPVSIESEMKKAYIDYSMSVIVSRALPDVRDGLKPVHRRILYAMNEEGLHFSGKTRKCATVVGDVLGRYHPHGDASVYDALVRLGQHFSMRYMPIHKQGNFGGIDGSPAAAYRYTESKMSTIAEEMVADIKKDTVDFIPNFDDTRVEPTVLPGKFPFLLTNGSSGIAVGMATNMPPHNLKEVCNAVGAYIDNPDISVDELCNYVKGPDFPTGGIIFGKKGIKQAYKTGRGKILIRGRFTIEVDKKGKESIVFTEIPFQVRTDDLCKRIGELARDKIIEGIDHVNDGSAGDDVRIVIDLKRGAIAKVVLNQLFSKTALQSSFGIINLALVNGRPEILDLKSLIKYFVLHRQDVVTRRTRFDLKKAEERAHIVRALIVAIDNIDEVIRIIRGSRDTQTAKNGLMERFGFDDIQAQAIVDMQLKRLTSLEIQDLRTELEELEALILHLKDLLEHPEKILSLIKDETNEMAEKYGDERRTDIVADEIERAVLEKSVRLFDRLWSFFLFRAVAEKPYRRLGYTEHVSHIHVAHYREFFEHLGSAIYVRTAVDDYRMRIFYRGNDGCERRAGNSFYQLDYDLRAHEKRSRIARADHRVGVSRRKGAQTEHHRTVLLSPYRECGSVVVGYRLARLFYGQPARIVFFAFKAFFYIFFFAAQHRNESLPLLQRGERAVHRHAYACIRAVTIHKNFHSYLLPYIVFPRVHTELYGLYLLYNIY